MTSRVRIEDFEKKRNKRNKEEKASSAQVTTVFMMQAYSWGNKGRYYLYVYVIHAWQSFQETSVKEETVMKSASLNFIR